MASGARGAWGEAPAASRRSMWVRIFSMMAGSSMQAMTCRDALIQRSAWMRGSDDPHRPAAKLTGLDIDPEHPIEALCQ